MKFAAKISLIISIRNHRERTPVRQSTFPISLRLSTTGSISLAISHPFLSSFALSFCSGHQTPSCASQLTSHVCEPTKKSVLSVWICFSPISSFHLAVRQIRKEQLSRPILLTCISSQLQSRLHRRLGFPTRSLASADSFWIARMSVFANFAMFVAIIFG